MWSFSLSNSMFLFIKYIFNRSFCSVEFNGLILIYLSPAQIYTVYSEMCFCKSFMWGGITNLWLLFWQTFLCCIQSISCPVMTFPHLSYVPTFMSPFLCCVMLYSLSSYVIILAPFRSILMNCWDCFCHFLFSCTLMFHLFLVWGS